MAEESGNNDVNKSGHNSKPATASNDKHIEEGAESYTPGGCHPVYIGDVYNNRYEVLRKIGYGQYSTVWLVRDRKHQNTEQEYRALKVLRADSYEHAQPIFEKEILVHLRDADPTHLGYGHVCHLKDDFALHGPNGKHVCLVFEVIGETLHSFRVQFGHALIPNPVMRRIVIQLLMALDYAHDNGVIHTDIKPDNIFVKFRDLSLLPAFLETTTPKLQDKSKPYTPLRSDNLHQFYFDQTDSPVKFDVCLGDWGVSCWTNKHLSEVIQPTNLRAPEVLIGAPWDWTTDWWNLGPVILESFRGVRMFVGQVSQYAPIDLKILLGEMVDFFGPFPKRLLDQGDQELVKSIFNEDGTVKNLPPFTGTGLISDDYMVDLPQQTREEFVAFLHQLMKIDPKERLPTMDILEMPWCRYGWYEH